MEKINQKSSKIKSFRFSFFVSVPILMQKPDDSYLDRVIFSECRFAADDTLKGNQTCSSVGTEEHHFDY